jgi:hypothetical protein
MSSQEVDRVVGNRTARTVRLDDREKGDVVGKAERKPSSWRTVRTFLTVGTCSETLIKVLDGIYDDPLPLEERAAMPFAGGIAQHGYQCGLIWGATLAAGARAFRLFGPGPEAETRAISAAHGLVESLMSNYGNIDCMELTGTDWKRSATVLKYLIKGGTFKCFAMAAKFARIAQGVIDAAFSEGSGGTPPRPANCASVLARKLGADERHTVMAAGLAGGIGLSGDACGALGTAIWIDGMNRMRAGEGKMTYKNPAALAIVEKFLESADYKFECSEIVGRTFQDIDDHARFIRDGGCSKIIEALAAL